MKKHRIIAIAIFGLVALLGILSNFIRWDETPLEQTLYVLPLGIGLLLQMPFLFVMSLFVMGMNVALPYTFLWMTIPFLAGATYGGMYYAIAKKIHESLQRRRS